MDLVQTVRKEGSRGGRADFKWEDVKADAQRENYLGHSLMAPVGRWQQNKDLNWYAKGDDESAESAAQKLKEEKRKLKQAEEDAMLVAMGMPVPERGNANLEPLGDKSGERAIENGGDDMTQEEKVQKIQGPDMGPPTRRRDRSRDRKQRSGRDRRDRDDGERRRRRSRSRSRDRRDKRRDRSRSRERTRKDEDGHRHRSRSREHRRRDERSDRHRDHRDRRIDKERPRSHSRERQRRRRSRSPYDKDRRRERD